MNMKAFYNFNCLLLRIVCLHVCVFVLNSGTLELHIGKKQLLKFAYPNQSGSTTEGKMEEWRN